MLAGPLLGSGEGPTAAFVERARASGGACDLRPEVPYTTFLAFLFGVGDDCDPNALSLPQTVADPGRAAVRLGVLADLAPCSAGQAISPAPPAVV